MLSRPSAAPRSRRAAAASGAPAACALPRCISTLPQLRRKQATVQATAKEQARRQLKKKTKENGSHCRRITPAPFLFLRTMHAQGRDAICARAAAARDAHLSPRRAPPKAAARPTAAPTAGDATI